MRERIALLAALMVIFTVFGATGLQLSGYYVPEVVRIAIVVQTIATSYIMIWAIGR